MVKVADAGIGGWGRLVITQPRASARLRVVKGVTRNPEAVADFAGTQGSELIADYAAVLAAIVAVQSGFGLNRARCEVLRDFRAAVNTCLRCCRA